MLLENFLNHFVFSLELSTLIWQINFSSLGEKCHASKIDPDSKFFYTCAPVKLANKLTASLVLWFDRDEII